jgi:multicomponent Na+:H+ antiporter subunit B
VRLRSLFAVVMLSGLYSLLSAAIFVILDAVDVAFTEAAVGAGITTVLFLGTLVLTDREEKQPARFNPWPMVVVVVTGAALVFGSLDMPGFGDPNAPANRHVVPEYLADTVRQLPSGDPVRVGIPNIVTTILASYRGYDTMGEVTVIFTAGIGVLLLLGAAARHGSPSPGQTSAPHLRLRRRKKRSEETGETSGGAA